MTTAQKIGIWGCLIVGIIMIVGTYLGFGTEEPMRYTGGVSLLMFSFAFWLFKKNADMMKDIGKDDKQDEKSDG
ncbi:hypothetical protein ACFO5Q_18240 [Kordiimonas lipolytica]|uniref:Uncharacterized protein n=1 Tax=Kordiimonas lipolytica TaxID=1662421 RepID=A0ABV8UG33_9PROT|nr:hypothetical protein [Kordiimonas lipolytica]